MIVIILNRFFLCGCVFFFVQMTDFTASLLDYAESWSEKYSLEQAVWLHFYQRAEKNKTKWLVVRQLHEYLIQRFSICLQNEWDLKGSVFFEALKNLDGFVIGRPILSFAHHSIIPRFHFELDVVLDHSMIEIFKDYILAKSFKTSSVDKTSCKDKVFCFGNSEINIQKQVVLINGKETKETARNKINLWGIILGDDMRKKMLLKGEQEEEHPQHLKQWVQKHFCLDYLKCAINVEEFWVENLDAFFYLKSELRINQPLVENHEHVLKECKHVLIPWKMSSLKPFSDFFHRKPEVLDQLLWSFFFPDPKSKPFMPNVISNEDVKSSNLWTFLFFYLLHFDTKITMKEKDVFNWSEKIIVIHGYQWSHTFPNVDNDRAKFTYSDFCENHHLFSFGETDGLLSHYLIRLIHHFGFDVFVIRSPNHFSTRRKRICHLYKDYDCVNVRLLDI